MKKRLMIVAAMAAVLMGAVSCTPSPLEKAVKEVNALLPEDDNEFIITSLEYDNNQVTITYDANPDEAAFVDGFIDIINEGGEDWLNARDSFIPEMLAYHFDYDVLQEMVKVDASLKAVFRNKASDKTAHIDITAEEVKASLEWIEEMRSEAEAEDADDAELEDTEED